MRSYKACQIKPQANKAFNLFRYGGHSQCTMVYFGRYRMYANGHFLGPIFLDNFINSPKNKRFFFVIGQYVALLYLNNDV